MAEPDEYLELDLGEYEEVFEEEPAGTYKSRSQS